MKKTIDVTETILIALTEEEVKGHAMELVTLLAEVDQAERELKAEKEHWKSKINEAKCNVERKRGIIAERVEPRKVNCKRMYDTEEGLTYLIYNGCKYHERNISEKELELLSPTLFEDDANPEELQNEIDKAQKRRGKSRSLRSA